MYLKNRSQHNRLNKLGWTISKPPIRRNNEVKHDNGMSKQGGADELDGPFLGGSCPNEGRQDRR
ncbi:unnamed protein product [Spodoptera exigua]|nr:unnamed protein product [Spodoptera exigua]